MTTPKNLEIGDLLEVRLDDNSRWMEEWITVEVKRTAICHNSVKDTAELDPYIWVLVEHPLLHAFNYSMYCLYGAVRFWGSNA